MASLDSDNPQVVAWIPCGMGGALVVQILDEAGIQSRECRTIDALCERLTPSAGALLLTDEGLDTSALARLRETLSRQPAWSDLPILVCCGPGDPLSESRQLAMIESLGNVTLLERPIRVTSLTSAVRAALRARKRQFALREILNERGQLIQQLEERAAAMHETGQRKDEFLAMLGHELRNPLAPIRSALTLMGMEKSDATTQLHAREIIERQMDHFVRMVDDLVDVSRLMRGKFEIRTQPIELAKVIALAVETSQPLIDSRLHRLTVELPGEPVWIEADPMRFAQAVSNLLGNAAKYTPRGGRIELSVEARDGQATLSVRDNGIGIAPKLLPAIFDPFIQGERTLDRAPGGLGIGLTLARQLVEMHGGSLHAHSEGPDAGSEFVVSVPVLREIPRNPQSPPTNEEVPKLRVLVVEDHVGSAQILAKMLRHLWGHVVELAHDGVSGLRAAQEFHPDLVLLDIGLPRMNGYEVARRLRQQPEFEKTLLVALTGYGQEEDRRKSADAGFDVHLVKPAGATTLQHLFAHSRAHHNAVEIEAQS